MSYANLFGDTSTTAPQVQPLEVKPKSGLPVKITDCEGRDFNITVADLTKFGTARAQKQSEMNNQILSKTMVADSGGMAGNMMQVMALTDKVDLNALNDNGFFGKLRSKFQDAKLRVKAQYTSVQGQLDALCDTMQKELDLMRTEANWLQNVYQDNLKEIEFYSKDLGIMRELMQKCELNLQELQNSGADTNTIEEARLTLNVVSRQCDTLVKMKSISDMTAPEVRAMQVSNMQIIEKYNIIITATIPVWKKKMALALHAENDRKRIEGANKIDAFTDDLLINTAKQVGQNMINSTKASQSNVASADAIIQATASLTNDIKESIKLEREGHELRKQNAIKIESAVGTMKDALKGN